MKDCLKYETLFEKLIGGDISDTEHKLLLDHIEVCSVCQSMLELHDKLSLNDWPVEKADQLEFDNMRKRVLNLLPDSGIKTVSKQKFSHFLKNLFPKPVYALVVAFSMMIAGFFIAQIGITGQKSNGAQFIRQINQVALNNNAFTDVQNSPYVFTDVQIKSQNGNKINLSFDVTTHVEIERQKNDPLVKEVLAQSLLNPSSVGTRLKAIHFAGNELDTKIKEALLFSMQNDANVAVRLKAMATLATIKKDSQITDAFINLLSSEKSVHMRILAIEYLANSDLNRDVLEGVIRESNRNNVTPVQIKMNEFIK